MRVYNLGDRVLAKTDIMRCKILGTIRQIHNDKILVVFDHTIRGKGEAWVSRSLVYPAKTEEPIEVKNRKIKQQAKKVIDGLEVIK